ncbi:MAG TPA: ABC transporter permease [Candidatus Cybelea sp.]|nr:ABC transporter permease [Candidatus Cybelea sp.]
MSVVRSILGGLRSLFLGKETSRELDEEVCEFLEMAAEEKMKQGMRRKDALRAVRLERGSREATTEVVRAAGWESLVEACWQDVRFAVRLLIKNPGSAAAIVIALGLGMGMNTTVFSFVNALLLRPPALVQAPDTLYQVWLDNPRSSGAGRYLPLTFPDYIYDRDHNQSFQGMLAFDGDPESVTWNRSGEGQVVMGQLVSGNFFSLLGVNTVLGRAISPEDDRTADPQPVVVLSHAFWRESLGSDPAIVGKTLMLNGANYRVIGVASEGFAGLLVGIQPDFWAPTTTVEQITRDTGRLRSWHSHWLIAVGRLKPEVSEKVATAEMGVLEHQIELDHPDLKRNLGATAFPETLIPGPYRGYVSAFTALLMAVFGLVLLIACANVASFLLARATGRTREVAVRSALGAGRGRLVRQMLVESTLLSGLAGLAGLILAYGTAPLLLALKPAGLPITLRLPVDWRVLVFTMTLSLVCGLAFGLAPALRAASVPLASHLKDETQPAGYRKSRLRSVLMTCEVATCTVLLVGATLCVRSLRNASSIDPGFNTQHVITATLDPGSLGYSEAQVRSFYAELSERVQVAPGITSVSFIDHLPLGPAREQTAVTAAMSPTPGEPEAVPIDVLRVAPGYFQTMGIPLLRGRDFSSSEDKEGSRVTIINEALARRLWNTEDPLGRRISFHEEKVGMEIIGVVKTGKYRTLGEDPLAVAYLPQLPPRRTLIVRTSGDPAILLGTIRREIHSVDLSMAATDLETMQQYMTLPLFPARTTGLLLGVSGFLALALTSIGLFGVISYIVSQRTQEIGVRMALGAQHGDVLKLVVRHGLFLTGIGLAIGLGLAMGAAQLLSSLLYGIAPTDPRTFLGVALLLCVVAVLACYIPARRAMRVDPMMALRHE